MPSGRGRLVAAAPHGAALRPGRPDQARTRGRRRWPRRWVTTGSGPWGPWADRTPGWPTGSAPWAATTRPSWPTTSRSGSGCSSNSPPAAWPPGWPAASWPSSGPFGEPEFAALAESGLRPGSATRCTRGSPCLYRNRSALPRARLVTGWQPVASLPEKDALEPFLDGIQAGDIDVAGTVYLDRTPDPGPGAGGRAPAGARFSSMTA